ncbi:hypothetical protein ACA758_03870 [Mycoplasmopsis agassizii]|uniref:hypothetical protein n=1 Tax=Mycoplasmopsis agassizii TaxID=33922 RepID=UPI0035273C1C
MNTGTSQNPVYQAAKASFFAGDWAVLAIYLILTLGVGVVAFFYSKIKKEKGTSNYFTGGGGRLLA